MFRPAASGTLPASRQTLQRWNSLTLGLTLPTASKTSVAVGNVRKGMRSGEEVGDNIYL